ncbi:hypothetical protein [Microbacterium aerolatum]|uniref:hypothetical protein n=1 Tax=Microbacterium aerolatum TaxID=153731 RepID=UPI00384CDCE4
MSATPEIWFAAQRTLRTIVQALIILIPLANGIALAATAYLQEQTHLVVPGWVFLVLNAVVAVTALVMGLVARLMAVPGVNDWLTKIGLGSVPKNAMQPTVRVSHDGVNWSRPVDVDDVIDASSQQRYPLRRDNKN